MVGIADSASLSRAPIPRRPGLEPGPIIRAGNSQKKVSDTSVFTRRHGVWVPAFAGTTKSLANRYAPFRTRLFCEGLRDGWRWVWQRAAFVEGLLKLFDIGNGVVAFLAIY